MGALSGFSDEPPGLDPIIAVILWSAGHGKLTGQHLEIGDHELIDLRRRARPGTAREVLRDQRQNHGRVVRGQEPDRGGIAHQTP